MAEPKAKRSDGGSQVAIRAIVGKVRGDGQKRFAVTYLEGDHPEIERGQSITFSISDWGGEKDPLKEQVVELLGVRLFRNGWRATSARPINLQPQVTSQEKG